MCILDMTYTNYHLTIQQATETKCRAPSGAAVKIIRNSFGVIVHPNLSKDSAYDSSDDNMTTSKQEQ